MSQPPHASRVGPRPHAIRAIEGPAALDLLDASWDAALAAGSPPGSPSQCGAWLRGIASRLPAGTVPLVVRADDATGGMLAGIALSVQPTRVGPTRIRIATWLGHQTRRVFSPDLIGARASPVAGAAVADHVLGMVDALVLRNTPTDAAVWDAVEAAAPWLGRAVATASWTVRLPDEALHRRIRSVAYDIRRAGRGGALVEVDVLEDPDTVRAATERMIELHSERWQADGDLSGFSRTETDRAFHRELLPEIAGGGGLGLAIAVVREDGITMGSTVFLHANGVAMLYRTAMSTQGVLRGPGVTATVSCLAHLEAMGVSMVDLGLGEQSFKSRLGGRMAPASGLIVAASHRWQRPLEAALRLRERARGAAP